MAVVYNRRYVPLCVAGDIDAGPGDDQHAAVRPDRHDAVPRHDGDAV